MVKTKTYQYKLRSLNQAIDSFKKSLSIELSSKGDTEADAIKNGQALKFSYTIELLWKTIKAFLYAEHGVECNSPKSCIKLFYVNVKKTLQGSAKLGTFAPL